MLALLGACQGLLPTLLLLDDFVSFFIVRVRYSFSKPLLRVCFQSILKPLLRIEITLTHPIKEPSFFETARVFTFQKLCFSLRQLRCRKDCLNAVVVASRNGIKLVVVASRTLKRMSEKRLKGLSERACGIWRRRPQEHINPEVAVALVLPSRYVYI